MRNVLALIGFFVVLYYLGKWGMLAHLWKAISDHPWLFLLFIGVPVVLMLRAYGVGENDAEDHDEEESDQEEDEDEWEEEDDSEPEEGIRCPSCGGFISESYITRSPDGSFGACCPRCGSFIDGYETRLKNWL